MTNSQPHTKNFFTDEFYNAVLFETDNFFAIPSLGSIVEGWVLIVPKRHYISMGAIRNDDLHNELDSFSSSIKDIVRQAYGNVILFEHGAARQNTAVGCGVDYAHLHIVPIDLDVMNLPELKNNFIL